MFVQITKTTSGFCNNLSLQPRLLGNPTSSFDICTNTSKLLFVSMIMSDMIDIFILSLD